jgi:hypothetical protein
VDKKSHLKKGKKPLMAEENIYLKMKKCLRLYLSELLCFIYFKTRIFKVLLVVKQWGLELKLINILFMF